MGKVMKSLLAAAVLLTSLAAIAQDATVRAQVTSSVEELRIVRLDKLPPAPASAAGRDLCAPWLTTPQTGAGHRVQSAGWGVTGEVSLGGFQLVSFVGSFEPGTSGSCLVGDGNVAIFSEGELFAIVYVPQGVPRTIGAIEPFETTGVRIWDGDYLRQPLADLRLADDGTFAVQPLAAEEKVCGGRGIVPNIYGKPINEARAALEQRDWLAVATSADPADPREADLAARGFLEVEGCSGTGFGFCSFNYEGPAGKLNITTVGDAEFPEVAGYGVTCNPG